MKLSDEQEEMVRNCVEEHGLKLKTLSDDIIDHLCCVIESRLKIGNSFDELLHNAMAELAPNGLIDLEHKTIFLLSAKRILIMKKLTYLIGLIGSVAFTFSFPARALRWPYASELEILGSLLLLVFVPLLFFGKYEVTIARTMSERLTIISGSAAAIFFGLGGLFKFLHWPGVVPLWLLAFTVFALGFLPFLFFTMYKKSIS